jgi:FkbM family methyltransferase
MNWRTHPWTIRARSVGRQIGVNRLIMALRGPRTYEDRFQRAMLQALRVGDCVWDVGANVGLYSAAFAERVGKTGHVFAFEPSPANLVELRAKLTGVRNVTILPMALGREAGSATLQQGADALGATSRIIGSATGSGVVQVEVARGADLAARGDARAPNLIKLDTEGYELDVLLGLAPLLGDASLRVICIEVHFGLLAERGMADAPNRIEKLLADAGFSLSWPDASHVVAERKPT